MIISIEDRFENLYNELKNMGHEVYKYSDHVISDVVVYSGSNTHIATLNTTEPDANERGVFLVNGDDKSASDISNIIRHKTYSTLF